MSRAEFMLSMGPFNFELPEYSLSLLKMEMCQEVLNLNPVEAAQTSRFQSYQD